MSDEDKSVELRDGEEAVDETFLELCNGKGDDEE